MTYNEESSVLECISCHYKSIFKNDESVDLMKVMAFGDLIELWLWVKVVYLGQWY